MSVEREMAQIGPRVREQLLAHEGLRLKPYRDSLGVLTIGVGRNLEANGITRHEANTMLEGDLYRLITAFVTRLAWWETLSVPRRCVLVDMAFQLGFEGLLKFRRFLAACRAGEWETAAAEMLDSRWAQQTPTRAQRLAEQMRTGDLQPLPAPSLEG